MNFSIAPALIVLASAAALLAPAEQGSWGEFSLLRGAHAQSVEAAGQRQPAPTQEGVRAQAIEIAKVRKLQQSRKSDEALRAARRAIKKFPDNTQLRFLLGVSLSEAGKLEEAIATFEALNRDHPELAEPYNNLAVLHASNGDLDAARDALVAAIRVVPNYTLALQNLGDVYLRMAERSYSAAVDTKGPTQSLKRKLTRARAVVESLTTDR